MTEAPPLVSVIICTRNRTANILKSAKSVLASDYPKFELLIVDESDNGLAATPLAPLLRNTSLLRYLPFPEKGKAKALHHGWRHARGQYLVLTDDDCEMAADCLSHLVKAFHAEEQLAVVFGDVAPAPYAPAREYIPKSRLHKANTIQRPADFLRILPRRRADWVNFGIGANMAIRAAALRAVGGWDLSFGPGEKFGSGDDHDLAFRLLRAGYRVHFCPDARVVHHGNRPLSAAPEDSRRVGRGFGASCAKHMKCGALYPGAIRTVPYNLARFCLHPFSSRHVDGATFALGWLSGFCAGLLLPVNRRTRYFEINP